MERSTALGLVGTTVVFAGAVLTAALSTVISRPSATQVALDTARESVKSALDAPRPEAVAPEAVAPAMTPAVATPSANSAKPTVAPPATVQLASPSWIWSSNQAGAQEKAVFARVFTLGGDATDAVFAISADNGARVLLDGREIAQSDEWEIPVEVDIGALSRGDHELIIHAQNRGGVAAVCAQLTLLKSDGVPARIVTDATWDFRGETGVLSAGATPAPATVVARYGDQPWGSIFGELDDSARADIVRSIAVPPGFICELVYVPPASRGSIISMTADDAHQRIIVSPQRGKAFAITPCAVGGLAADSTVAAIKPDIGEAHGLLAIDNDLFAVVSRGGPDEQGIWRLRDTNRDGTYDEKKLLASVARDGGEHGPHQIVLAPDGALWIVGGNHCAPPDAALEHSLLPKVWREDIAFDRIWDPNGHAIGVMAPGGWVVRTDREGAKWELVTAGFRNSYDLAFDRVGRAYTFDSDMEWDMGMPWYRPTRIAELASGVDYGWRSGSGKWPEWSPDSFAPAVDVGPASPTGVLSAAGLQFPPPWNDAMFFLDWTFGTIWAAWPTDESVDDSSPKLRLEQFLAGQPMPVTDAVVLDGAMYVSVGGRGLPSALYRIRATNPIAIKREAAVASAALVQRRAIEQFHHALPVDQANAAIDIAFNALASSDAGVRSAARIALEHQPSSLWAARAVMEQSDAQASILALVALCRTGDASRDGVPVATQLLALEPTVRGTALEKEWLRACELWYLRFASEPTTQSQLLTQANLLRDALLLHFPAAENDIDRVDLDLHRVNLLAKLGAPEAVTTALVILERPDVRTQPKMDAALLARGGPYGKAVTDMLANAPSTERIGIAYAVRNATNGWNNDTRMRFAHALASLSRAQGGNSFAGFLARIAEEFRSHAPDAQQELLATTIAGRSSNESGPIARGPGRAWTTQSIVALAPKLAAGRDHQEGLRAFHAAQCSACHRAGGIGGSGGPELSGVSRRFSVEDLAMAIAEPSRIVSDQYQFTDITLKNGSIISGRIVGDDGVNIEVRTSLLSDARDAIVKADIVSTKASLLSPMPAHVVDALSEGEMLDLMAFLRAGGDAGDSAFLKVDDDGYLELFNGNSLAGFTFDPRFWSLDTGQLVGRTTTANPAPFNTFFVWNGEVSDFELEVELQVVGNNSGVQYRSEIYDDVRMRGPQIDAHPSAEYVAMCYEEGARGILATRNTQLVIAADGTRVSTPLAGASEAAPDPSQWHTYRVVARGNTMEHFCDGVPTAKVVDDSKERARGQKIGVQIHAGEPTEVRVRMIRLRRLDK